MPLFQGKFSVFCRFFKENSPIFAAFSKKICPFLPFFQTQFTKASNIPTKFDIFVISNLAKSKTASVRMLITQQPGMRERSESMPGTRGKNRAWHPEGKPIKYIKYEFYISYLSFNIRHLSSYSNHRPRPRKRVIQVPV